jgi:ADP-ribosyl-[dinitrogen reductase] hydrolase
MAERSTRCLLGGALGDALGYPVEFVSSGASIVAAHGASAPTRLLRCDDGLVHVSDDTQMTLFTVEGIDRARGGGIVDAVHAAYQRWLWTQMPSRFEKPEGGGLIDIQPMLASRAPGNTCISALVENVRTGRVPSVSAPPNDSKGCGAVMRSAPFGLMASTREEAFGLARDAGVLTHGHPSGYLTAAYFASVVHDLVRGEGLDSAAFAANALLARERGYEETRDALVAVRSLEPSYEAIEALPNGGWVGEWALAIALACVRGVDVVDESAVAQALWRAAAHGGDSDSTASLAGNLLGAMGAKLPATWLAELELRDVITNLASRLDEKT